MLYICHMAYTEKLIGSSDFKQMPSPAILSVFSESLKMASQEKQKA